MLKGWLRKGENTSSQSLNSLAEPQSGTFNMFTKPSKCINLVSSGGRHARYDALNPQRNYHAQADMRTAAALHIMNDDLESAESGLSQGNSAFHKV